MFENSEGIGWTIPTIYGDDIKLVPVPNDEDGQKESGALEIGTSNAFQARATAILNRDQVQNLINVLRDALRDW